MSTAEQMGRWVKWDLFQLCGEFLHRIPDSVFFSHSSEFFSVHQFQLTSRWDVILNVISLNFSYLSQGRFGVQGWSIALNGFVSAAETNFFVYTELTWIQVTDLRDLIQRGWVSIMASLVNGVEISWLQLYLFTFCRSDSTFPVLCLDQMEAWLPMPHTSQFISVPCRKLCNIRFKQHYFQLNTT